MTAFDIQPATLVQPWLLDVMVSPVTGQRLHAEGSDLCTADGAQRYPVSPEGIPSFQGGLATADAAVQEEHYDRIADAYVENLHYPHTVEYMRYLDRVLLDLLPNGSLGTTAEICCGHGEAFKLAGARMTHGVGVDVSQQMLRQARHDHASDNLAFIQGDATRLPLASGAFDTVFMLGGIHHVNDRQALFSEIARILRPGGVFYYREPVSDFFIWRWLRALIYRLSPALDHETERPLRRVETIPPLERNGFVPTHWSTHGFLGFCLFMNSDVLVVNRWFRYVPGIRAITRFFTRFDAFVTALPPLRNAGLQVVGSATKGDAQP